MAFIKSVEAFEISLGSTDLTGAYTFTKGQDPNNCVPFVTYWLDQAISNDTNAMMFFDFDFIVSGPDDQVEVTRNTHGGGASEVWGYIVEFDATSVTVQRKTFSSTSATTDITIDTITQGDSFVYGHHQSTAGTDDFDDACLGYEFTSNTNVRLTRDNTSGTLDGHLWVVSAIGASKPFSVVHDASGDLDLTSGLTTNTLTISAVTMDQTFILVSGVRESGNDDPDQSTATLELASTTTVVSTRESSGSPNEEIFFRTQVIEILDSDTHLVQRGLETLPSNIDPAPQSVTVGITTIDPDRAFIVSGSFGNGANHNGRLNSSNNGPGRTTSATRFSDNSTVQVQRSNNNPAMPVAWQAMEATLSGVELASALFMLT